MRRYSSVVVKGEEEVAEVERKRGERKGGRRRARLRGERYAWKHLDELETTERRKVKDERMC